MRYDYDQQISHIRSDIAAIGMSIFHVAWRAVLRFTARTPSGEATGAAPWTATIPLLVGTNVVTVRAYDAAGNTSWRTLTIVRR